MILKTLREQLEADCADFDAAMKNAGLRADPKLCRKCGGGRERNRRGEYACRRCEPRAFRRCGICRTEVFYCSC